VFYLRQCYTIELWCGIQNMSVVEMTDLVYKIGNKLKEFGDELDPKYLKVRRKKDATPFIFNKENLTCLIQNSVNKENGNVFLDLGRTFSFFTSMEEEKSAGMMFHLGCTNPMFNNFLSIDLPNGNFSGFSERRKEFYNLFKILVEILNPYYAFVYNQLNKQLSETFWEKKPKYVHWINYYSNEMTKKIGEKKVKSLDEIEIVQNGVFLKLFEESLDIGNKSHLEKQRQISKRLGLL
jgi:hypothetical protein